jgi:hypothetical protein
MSENVEFAESPGRTPSPGQIVARIGISSIGAANTIVSFDAGQTGLVDEIGYGPLAAATRRALRYGRQKAIAALAAVDVAGTVSAVTKTGGGPTVTCAAVLADGDQIAGPWLAFPNLLLTIVREGDLGVARAEFSYDGVTTHETVDIAPKLPASLIGTVDLTGITLATLNAKTFIFDPDGGGDETVTFTTPSSVADIATQINAVVADSASIVAGRYLKISGATLGSAGSIEIKNGTANADLGFTNTQSADGVDSTYSPQGVGITFTFPAGAYELGTTYEVTTTAPKMATTDFDAAAAALRASGEAFAILHVVYDPVDGIDLQAWQVALEAFRVECATAEDNPIFFKWVLGSVLAPVEDWDDVDLDVKTTLAGTQEDHKFNTIVHGDVFLDFVEYSGRHRAQLALPYVERLARYALNVNPGLGAAGKLEACYLKNLDNTKARTEAEALVKMEDFGFSVLRDDKQLPYIRAGRTRAPITSQLTGEHTTRAALECARVLRDVAFSFSNSLPDLAPDGSLSPTDKVNIENAFNDALQNQIVEPRYASSARAIVTKFETIGGANKVYVTGIFQRLAWVKDTNIVVYVTPDATAVTEVQ